MADDVQRISGTSARAAARLCNFKTSEAGLLSAHLQYLDSQVAPVIQNMVGPWVDLYGYASRSGAAQYNQTLSEKRMNAVKDRISTFATDVNFQQQVSYGESDSGPNEADNSGYYRSVEVYVYAQKPPPRRPPPSAKPSTEFEIRVVGGGSASLIAQADYYFFQIVDLVRKKTCFFFYTGAGVGISVPKIPGPGSVTKMGPPTKFTTTRDAQLHQFNSPAQLFQDAGLTAGSISLGGTLRLSIDEVKDNVGIIGVRPSIIPIEGGSGIQMPGLGSASKGTLAKVSDVFEFTGY